MTRIALNGMGRIGRSILRALCSTRADTGLEVVACNDIAGLDLSAYLLKYDSVFGPFPGEVSTAEGRLVLNGQEIAFSAVPDLRQAALPQVDLALDCTGKATTSDFAAAGLDAGARRVLISGPSPVAELCLVLGANDATLDDQRLVSIGSCTTNAIAPLMSVLEASIGIVAGHMTTIHCYTGSQPTVDAPRGGFERSRAAALSMVPTTTSAGVLLDQVRPDLAGRVTMSAVRVPTASVSAIDFSFSAREAVTVDAVNAVLQAATGPILGVTSDPVVSTDLRARPESIVMATPETRSAGAHQCRVFGWYDNEWGFANRMIDVALQL